MDGPIITLQSSYCDPTGFVGRKQAWKNAWVIQTCEIIKSGLVGTGSEFNLANHRGVLAV